MDSATPGPPPGSTPPIQPTFWDENRKELRGWLERNGADHLGQLYEGCLMILYTSNFPGRKRFVSHAVREIRNRLPDVIAGKKAGGTFQWKNRLDDLVVEWKRAGISFDGPPLPPATAPSATPAPANPGGVPIPKKLFEKIQKALKDHAETREKPLEAARRLFEAVAPENKKLRTEVVPLLEQWIEITEWFVNETHESVSPGGASNASDELIKKFQQFELTLLSLVGKFFKTLGGLDEILEDTNN